MKQLDSRELRNWLRDKAELTGSFYSDAKEAHIVTVLLHHDWIEFDGANAHVVGNNERVILIRYRLTAIGEIALGITAHPGDIASADSTPLADGNSEDGEWQYRDGWSISQHGADFKVYNPRGERVHTTGHLQLAQIYIDTWLDSGIPPTAQPAATQTGEYTAVHTEHGIKLYSTTNGFMASVHNDDMDSMVDILNTETESLRSQLVSTQADLNRLRNGEAGKRISQLNSALDAADKTNMAHQEHINTLQAELLQARERIAAWRDIADKALEQLEHQFHAPIVRIEHAISTLRSVD